MKTRAIAEAKVKTDKVDAAILAQLLAADYLPGVWVADEATHALRRQVARRALIVRQRTRLKNQVQAILHRNLIARCPFADLFGIKGGAWMAVQDLPGDERQAVEALLRQLDFQGQELRIIDAALGRIALEREEVRRLMTIPGVDATVALSLVAAVGDFRRFRRAEQLVSYLGLNPRVRQSGGQPASHRRITKQGRAHARGMLVEAAFTAAKIPGPLRAFFERVRARRGTQIAIVATARKLVCLCWTMIDRGEDYVRTPVADRQETPRARTARRDASAARPKRRGRQLLTQRSPPARARARRAGRTRVPPARRGLASQTIGQQGGRGRRQWGATVRSPNGTSCAAGPSPRPCSSLGGRPRPHASLARPLRTINGTRPLTFSSVV
jgi:transposase